MLYRGSFKWALGLPRSAPNSFVEKLAGDLGTWNRYLFSKFVSKLEARRVLGFPIIKLEDKISQNLLRDKRFIESTSVKNMPDNI